LATQSLRGRKAWQKRASCGGGGTRADMLAADVTANSAFAGGEGSRKGAHGEGVTGGQTDRERAGFVASVPSAVGTAASHRRRRGR